MADSDSDTALGDMDICPIVSVAGDKMSATCEDGQILPVTNWMDAAGDECNPIDALQLVAGPTPDNKWCYIDLGFFQYARDEDGDPTYYLHEGMVDVENIDLERALVTMTSGEVLAVTNWLDIDDFPAEDRESAVWLVTAPSAEGSSYRIRINPEPGETN